MTCFSEATSSSGVRPADDAGAGTFAGSLIAASSLFTGTLHLGHLVMPVLISCAHKGQVFLISGKSVRRKASLSKVPVDSLARNASAGFADSTSFNFVPHFGHCVSPGGMGVLHSMQCTSFAPVRSQHLR